MTEAFFFGIPLIARAAATDWRVVDHLLSLTLCSVLAQEDRDFRVVLAAHDEPACWAAVAHDPRFALVRADWAADAPTPANDDGGRKKWLIKQHVRAAGGGLLMFLDADDWVSRDLVKAARGALAPDVAAGLVTSGYALDLPSLHAAPFPISPAVDLPFPALCGSSTVARIVPGDPDPLRADPHATLGSHHQWPERAAALGIALARIEAVGMYLVGTGQNHSEHDSPVAAWRRDVTRAVVRAGAPLDAILAARFGQRIADLRSPA